LGKAVGRIENVFIHQIIGGNINRAFPGSAEMFFEGEQQGCFSNLPRSFDDNDLIWFQPLQDVVENCPFYDHIPLAALFTREFR
jgi:hypothetical protein